MEPQPDNFDLKVFVLRLAIQILGLVSILFLLILIITYLVSRRLHTLRHSIHLNQCVACLLATVFIVIPQFFEENEFLCPVFGVLMHFFYTALILWSAVESVQLYLDTAETGMESTDAAQGFALTRHAMKFYMLVGWGIPIVVVGTVLAMTTENYQRHEFIDFCWLVEAQGMLWSFACPFTLAICINVLVLILVYNATDDTVRDNDKTTGFRAGFSAMIFFTFACGTAWMSGWQAIYGGPLWSQFYFVISVSLLGVVLFVVHGLSNVEVRSLMCRDDPDLEVAVALKIRIPMGKQKGRIEKPIYIHRPEDPVPKVVIDSEDGTQEGDVTSLPNEGDLECVSLSEEILQDTDDCSSLPEGSERRVQSEDTESTGMGSREAVNQRPGSKASIQN